MSKKTTSEIKPILIEGKLDFLKPSAIQRELDFVVIVNNIDNVSIIENKVHSNIIKEKIMESNFVILNRIKDDKDLYNEIDGMISTMKGTWCELNPSYMSNQLYKSDFIIFINDGKFNENEYQPLCIAYIKLYDVNKYKFLYTSILCSDRNYGQCGSKLMNAIKYLSSLLECSEIILDSVDDDNTIEFYKSQKFIDIESLLPYHNFKYIVSNKDKKKIVLPEIEGSIASLKSSSRKSKKKSKKKKTIKNMTRNDFN
jgi:hypothetical protein